MIRIASADDEERRILFLNTAEKMNINPSIVEKDFWVCLCLDYLFHYSDWKNCFAFKGGTSLSKAYHAIHRFSEDIDLVLDWHLLGYEDSQLWEDRSHTKQDQYNKRAVQKASEFLSEKPLPSMEHYFQENLSRGISLQMDPNDREQCTVNVYYPHVFSTEYVRQEICLEIGPLAEAVPCHLARIVPFAAEQYPGAFFQPDTEVKTIDAERTFWEKAIILHKTASSYELKGIPKRYARHYYDLFCLSRTEIKQKAFNHPELLDRDIRFKTKFYYSQSASYETAKIGSIRLVPPAAAVEDLKEDYVHMRNMIFQGAPDFNEIMDGLSSLEREINGLS